MLLEKRHGGSATYAFLGGGGFSGPREFRGAIFILFDKVGVIPVIAAKAALPFPLWQFISVKVQKRLVAWPFVYRYQAFLRLELQNEDVLMSSLANKYQYHQLCGIT